MPAMDIYTALARAGLYPNDKGWIICPFHDDTKPSLKIYGDTDSAWCFACKTYVSVFRILTDLAGMDRQEADKLSPQTHGSKRRRRDLAQWAVHRIENEEYSEELDYDLTVTIMGGSPADAPE